MAKKKKLHKKQQRQHKQSFAKSHGAALSVGHSDKGSDTPVAASPAPLSAGATSVADARGYAVDNLDLIRKDVRKVIVLATTFVLIQLVLWVLFEHTGLGTAVYGFIKV